MVTDLDVEMIDAVFERRRCDVILERDIAIGERIEPGQSRADRGAERTPGFGRRETAAR